MRGLAEVLDGVVPSVLPVASVLHRQLLGLKVVELRSVLCVRRRGLGRVRVLAQRVVLGLGVRRRLGGEREVAQLARDLKKCEYMRQSSHRRSDLIIGALTVSSWVQARERIRAQQLVRVCHRINRHPIRP